MYPIIRKLEILGSIPTCTPDGDEGWRLPPVESLYFTGPHAPIHHVDAIKISTPYVGVNSLTPIRYEVHGGIDTPHHSDVRYHPKAGNRGLDSHVHPGMGSEQRFLLRQ